MPRTDTIPLSLDELDYNIDTDSIDVIPLVPEGTYSAIVVRMEPYMAKSGRKCVYFHCRLTDAEWGNVPPMRLSAILPPEENPKEGWAFARAIKALGVSSKEHTSIRAQILAAIERPCQVVVKHQIVTKQVNGEDQKTTYAQVDQLLPASKNQNGAASSNPDELF